MVMHDIGRTQMETGWESAPYGEDEYSYESEYESEFDFEDEYFGEGPFSDADEMELASELLEITDDEELDQFISKAVGRIRRSLNRSSVGRRLRGALRNVAKKALPAAGAAVGGMIAPGVGTAIGGRVGSAAGRMLGLELEGLTPEDEAFEVSRRIVRLVGEAAENAAEAPPSAPPQAVVKKAIADAARKHAPGLVPSPNGGTGRGVWIRRGKTIVLHGV